jgi:hypothetical protein
MITEVRAARDVSGRSRSHRPPLQAATRCATFQTQLLTRQGSMFSRQERPGSLLAPTIIIRWISFQRG